MKGFELEPFTHTGLVHASAFSVRLIPDRSRKSYKGYGALFIFCVTRAFHLELISDKTSQGFLAACQCFVVRRGKPSNLYTDIFQSAHRELRYNIVQLKKHSDLFILFFL